MKPLTTKLRLCSSSDIKNFFTGSEAGSIFYIRLQYLKKTTQALRGLHNIYNAFKNDMKKF